MRWFDCAALIAVCVQADRPPTPPPAFSTAPLHDGALNAIADEIYAGDIGHAAALPWESGPSLWRPTGRRQAAWHRDDDGEPILTAADLWDVVRAAASVQQLGRVPEAVGMGSDVEVIKAVLNASRAEKPAAAKGKKKKSLAGPHPAAPSRRWVVSTMSWGSDPDALQGTALQQGHSLVVRNLERRWPAAHALCSELRQAIGCPCDAAAWLTPPAAAATPPHTDLRELFVMQVSGRKTWRLWDAADTLLPRADQLPAAGTADNADPSVATSYELGPGDVLFIPRGTMLHADTHKHDETSLHVTVGVGCAGARLIWEEYLHHALGEHSSRLREVEDGAPQGFDPPSASEDVVWRVAWRAVMHLMIRVASQHSPVLRQTVPGLAGAARDWDRIAARFDEVKRVLEEVPYGTSPSMVLATPVNESRVAAWVLSGTRVFDAAGAARAVTSNSREVATLLSSLQAYLADLSAQLWDPPPGAGGVASAMEDVTSERRKLPGPALTFKKMWAAFIGDIREQPALQRMAAVRQAQLDAEHEKAVVSLRMHNERRNAL